MWLGILLFFTKGVQTVSSLPQTERYTEDQTLQTVLIVVTIFSTALGAIAVFIGILKTLDDSFQTNPYKQPSQINHVTNNYNYIVINQCCCGTPSQHQNRFPRNKTNYLDTQHTARKLQAYDDYDDLDDYDFDDYDYDDSIEVYTPRRNKQKTSSKLLNPPKTGKKYKKNKWHS